MVDNTRDRFRAAWARVRPWKPSFPDSSVLILCGTGRLNPDTRRLLPPEFRQFVFTGLHGVNCHADFRNPTWRTRCFGNRTFSGAVMEYCDYAIHHDVFPALKSLVRPGGFFLYMGHRGAPPAIPGFTLARRIKSDPEQVPSYISHTMYVRK